jgi:adenine-specific DNA methylase
VLKRLIEVALPLKEVSEQSAREKSIRHGHISTLHIWWARRPLAACRAAVFASLIPDPDDPECPKDFRKLVMEILKHERFRPNGETNGNKVEDTPRNRCLEFIKHLVKWDNSNNPDLIQPARKLIVAAHKLLHPGAEADAPRVLDPFAGGGAIPLEALRLGCAAHAVDLNPVAHLLQLCTLVYPQKYGQPDSRPVPNYIQRLIVHNRAKKKAKGGSTLFEKHDGMAATVEDDEIMPDVEITEAQYRKNPLSADVKYWGHWVLEAARVKIGQLYPESETGGKRVAYLWANTLPCPNPACRATVPLIKQFALATSTRRKFHLRMVVNDSGNGVVFHVGKGTDESQTPTILQGAMRCPVCQQGVYDKNEIKKAARTHGLGTQPLCVVLEHPKRGRDYREFEQVDLSAFDAAKTMRDAMRSSGAPLTPIPNELIGRDFEWVLKPPMFGLNAWGDVFNARQQVALGTLSALVDSAPVPVSTAEDDKYHQAVKSYLALAVDRHADYNSMCQSWHNGRETLGHTFGRQAIAMSWDYCEANPFSGASGDFAGQLDWLQRVIEANSFNSGLSTASVQRGTAGRLPLEDGSVQCVLTDPPYYDAVPYADLSDFFYVWLKRSLKSALPDLVRTPLTPKADELVQQSEKVTSAEKRKKTKDFFEKGMRQAMREVARTLAANGIAFVMFAHKTTSAWEQLIAGLLDSGLNVTASWPFHTELKTRLRGQGAAALASSVTLVARKRTQSAEVGFWDDIRKELQRVAKERLDFFWSQGIRGADFFISAIGPALSVFGKYEKVTKLSGEEVTVGQFLDEVRGLVTNYALAKILKTTHTANIDSESRFYVVWKWSYGEAKVPADESFKLAQALGMDTETMWDRSGVLEKSGENVQAVPVAKRMKIKDLGEPNADSTPASLIDVLHRMCVFRDKGDTDAMAEFLGRSGQGKNPTLWLVAQAVSEILPDGDKEKQLMQGLLNQREKLDQEPSLF